MKNWVGTLKIGLVRQNVVVYGMAALKPGSSVPFKMLHRACGRCLSSKMHCSSCDETVIGDTASVVRGHDVGGQFVRLESDEIDDCRIPSTTVIDLKHFVPAEQVTPFMIAESRFIGPTDHDAADWYWLIRTSLGTAVAGIGRLSISSKDRVVAVMRHQIGLSLHVLRHADELRHIESAMKAFSEPPIVHAKTRKLMQAHIASKTRHVLDLTKYRSKYVDNLRDLVASKRLLKTSGRSKIRWMIS